MRLTICFVTTRISCYQTILECCFFVVHIFVNNNTCFGEHHVIANLFPITSNACFAFNCVRNCIHTSRLFPCKDNVVGCFAECSHTNLFWIWIRECYDHRIVIDTLVSIDYASPYSFRICRQVDSLTCSTSAPQVFVACTCIKSNSCSIARCLIFAKVDSRQVINLRQVERINADALHTINSSNRVRSNFRRNCD